MNVHDILMAVLLGPTVALVLMCALGVMVMRDPLQRLHYVAPPATLSAVLIIVAVVLDRSQKHAWFKTMLVTVVLYLMNAVVTHATARAARIRELRRYRTNPDERIPIVGWERFMRHDEQKASRGQEG